jgi:hypothetical protein
MTSLRDSDEFRRGRSGERVIAELLKRRGWFIVPAYDFAGEEGEKVPKMEGLTAAFILPDLDISKGGDRRWAEVKTKTAATLHRRSGVSEHGIAIRHLQHYRSVESETGCEVWIFIVEENTRLALCARLKDLGPGRQYDGPKMSRGGMVFWPRASFRVFAELERMDP